MPFPTSINKVAVLALLLSHPWVIPALASPSPLLGQHADPRMPQLEPRTIGGFSVWNLFNAVREYLEDKNAWDPDVPGKCAMDIQTIDGGNCQVRLQCQETDAPGDILQPDPWNACYLHGTQNFSNSDIGDFSITFTGAGGKDGNKVDGLHTPVVRFENLNNWEALDIEHLVAAEPDPTGTGNLCGMGSQNFQPLTWFCGIPKVGQAAFGISNIDTVPNQNNQYTPGRCTMHVVQYQRNEFGVGGDYAFDVVLYDAVKKQLAVKQQAVVDPTTKALNVDSALPLVVVITAGADDHSKVTFRYGDQTWACGDGHDTGGDHQCTLAAPGEDEWGYEAGNRKGDMGFDC